MEREECDISHTLAFNTRHLSQAIPTRWRFIVMNVWSMRSVCGPGRIERLTDGMACLSAGLIMSS